MCEYGGVESIGLAYLVITDCASGFWVFLMQAVREDNIFERGSSNNKENIY